MKNFPKSLVIAGVAIVAAYAIWHVAYPSGTWRYRMIVTIETPEGIKTGSAVREVYAYREPELLGVTTGGHTHLAKGEAVAVDLGKRGVLFALMRGGFFGQDYGWDIVYDALPFSNSTGETTRDIILHYRSLKSGKATLAPEQYPLFVRFRDITNPATVESVYETNFYNARGNEGRYFGKAARIQDRLADAFGAGVKIKEVTVEITDAPTTWGIEKWLPWLPARKGIPGYLGSTPNDAGNDASKLYLNGIEFSVGRFW